VIKFPKDKKVKPTDQSEVHQPVVGEAGPRKADPRAVVQPFAPMIEPRSIADLKVNHRNARTHSEPQIEKIAAIRGLPLLALWSLNDMVGEVPSNLGDCERGRPLERARFARPGALAGRSAALH